MTKVNSDVVGKLVNIASRCAGFIHKLCAGVLVEHCPDAPLIDSFVQAHASVAEAYEAREYSRVIREVMALADRANQYIDEHKPWQLAKDPSNQVQVHRVCSMGIVMFYHLMVDLAPIMPRLAADAAAFLQVDALGFDHLHDLFGKPVAEFKPLINRVDPAKVAAMLAENEPLVPTTNLVIKTESQVKPVEKTMTTDASTIDINAFMAVHMVVGKVCSAETVEGADKLLKLQVDIGEATPRQIFSGIRASYTPEQLLGKLVIVVANLAPRKMRFGLSEGMVIAAGSGSNIYLLSPDEGAQPGDKVS
jgi:methionyl-tRNA synthetase